MEGKPVVALANWYQFGASERATRPRVESRMLLWCVSGKGKIVVNGHSHTLSPAEWFLLPWKHEIIYEPDPKTPFFVGGIHIIPRHLTDIPVIFQVAHSKSDALANHPGRMDDSWTHLNKLVTGYFANENDRLALLATYTVERFQNRSPERLSMETLAGFLIYEIGLATSPHLPSPRSRPASLHRMQIYARSRLDRLLTVEDLAEVGQCSTASVHRQFRTFESLSPGQWVAQLRTDRAAFLLRTTRLSVQEVGEQVGLPDPFHFSRFFKRNKGLSPRAYQQTHRFF